MQNLLEETIDMLHHHDKTPSDVKWVGSADGEFSISWFDFEQIAKDVNYDDGFGLEEIPMELVVVGDNWWLSRVSYDGSEWWIFNTIPVQTSNSKSFHFAPAGSFDRWGFKQS